MSKSILIIEDDKDIKDLLEMIISSGEYQVTALDRTDDILDSIEIYKPDLVLTDYLLPGLNGGKICSLIKTNQATAHIPVVLVSGFNNLAKGIGDLEFDAYIGKPFDIKEIQSTVDRFLTK